MKIYTSYFYKIRFFKPNMIPISTALWDPKWYHQGKGQDHWFIDKNGVINGLRAPVFAPTVEAECMICDHTHYNECGFLRNYTKQLSLLDFSDIMARTERLCEMVRSQTHFEGEPIAVFIVHESPDNPCSERAAIQEYFRSNGIQCEEWNE